MKGLRGTGQDAASATSAQFAAFIAGCGKLYTARSRLYRNEILQENMRLKALAEIYTMHSFAQLCNLNFFVKMLQKVSLIFANCWQHTIENLIAEF